METPTITTPTTTSLPPLPLSLLTDEELFESEQSFLNDLIPFESLDTLDATLSRLLSQLDLATNDTSTLVDRTIDDISRSVPRLTFDLQLMRENALLLRFTLDSITHKSGTTTTNASTSTSSTTGFGEHPDVAKVMEKLRVLDLVKSRMEAARDVLREAESWSTLESEVTALVSESSFSKAAERLEEANRSLIVFQNTSEYEQRRSLMISLQNQLEASLSTQLVKAIQARDVKGCKNFFNIFTQIEREGEFTSYYFGSRRASLVESWTKAPLLDCVETGLNDTTSSTTTSEPLPFTSFLSKFYSDLHSLLNEERTYVPFIFPDPIPTLSSFIITTLDSLTPSLSNRLSSIHERYGPQILPELIKAYKNTEEFAVMVERIMAKLELASSTASVPNTATTPSTPGGGTPAKRDRRMSKRQSMSKRHSSRSLSFSSAMDFVNGAAGDESGVVRAWETSLFEPFLDHQVLYASYEKSYLSFELEKLTQNRDLMSYLSFDEKNGGEKEFWELTMGLFVLMEESIGRNLALTHGYAAGGLVGVLDSLFVGYLEKRKIELGRVGKSIKLRRGEGGEGEVAFEGLEYSNTDWTAFQNGLRLLSTCRALTERLYAFEERLKARLMTLANTVKEMREGGEAGYTIPGTTRGAVLLLRQSTLNSAELNMLLGPLEKGGSGTTPPLLPKSRHATTDFTSATQLFLHDTILSPLLRHLSEYSTLAVWTSSDQQNAGKGAFDLSIPTFSLSPTEIISKVGEGLFNLPRLFEVYRDDDALSWSIETLPFVDEESLRRSVEEEMEANGIRVVQPPTPKLGHRLSSSTSQLDDQIPTTSTTTSSTPPTKTPLSAETVIATWLSSLTLSILSHLTTVVLPSITRLTKHGSNQLTSDLSYISNVARALDVDSTEELDSWREATEEDAAGDKEKDKGELNAEQRKVWDRVARIRGYGNAMRR